jgi:hypothetical protein
VAALKIPENFLYYLSLHEGCNERLLARAGRFRAEEVEVSLHPEDARIKKMALGVLGEMHKMKAFVRLSFLGTSALYGFFKPRHRYVFSWPASRLAFGDYSTFSVPMLPVLS